MKISHKLRLAHLLHEAARMDDPNIGEWEDLTNEERDRLKEVAELVGEGVGLLVEIAVPRVLERLDV